MKRKEKQQKFHDSLINMLYAPPSPPPQPPHENEFDQQTLNLAREIANSDHHQINTDVFDEEKCLSASSEEDDELGVQKLTRAQRKRLRKKKLKESASNCRQIIGPELPHTSNDQIDCKGNKVHEIQQSEGVRRNASERLEKPSCIKVKHRRMSKKKAIDKPETPHEATSSHKSHGDQN